MLQPLSAYRGIQRVQLEVLHVVDKVHGRALQSATEDLALHGLLAGSKCEPRAKPQLGLVRPLVCYQAQLKQTHNMLLADHVRCTHANNTVTVTWFPTQPEPLLRSAIRSIIDCQHPDCGDPEHIFSC